MQYLTITVEHKSYPVLALPGRPKALLDRTVAAIYDVQTREVNQAVKNNPEKFPDDFCFQLTRDEFEDIKIFDILGNIKYSRVLPKAFTQIKASRDKSQVIKLWSEFKRQFDLTGYI